jgi:predicted nucleic acid-binding protein
VTDRVFNRMRYLPTTLEAARRAGRYQAEFAARGIAIQTPDALIAGTARAHGAILITANVVDFPMPDIRLVKQPTG